MMMMMIQKCMKEHSLKFAGLFTTKYAARDLMWNCLLASEF
jgi:hypothetical protein